MNRRELESAIKREVESWPGVTVEIVDGGKHPKAKFTFDGNMLSQPFSGTPSDTAFGMRNMLGDMRRAMKRLGAVRDKPEPSQEEDEAPYRKPNDGAEKRETIPARDPVEPKPSIADKMVTAGAATPEQDSLARRGTISDDGEVDAPDDSEANAAAIQAAAEAIVDGIYFGLDEDVYHKVARLSPTGLKQLCISAGTFWKDSWLDPNPTVLTDEEEARKRKARVIGRAYHTARLEPHLMGQRYTRAISKADFPAKGLLTSDTAVKAALKECGMQQTVWGESTIKRAERLEDAGYDGTIWPLEVARWRAEIGDLTPIDAKTWDEIAIDMERMQANEDVAPLLSDGAAEVSLFWTDADGIKMKTRLDYLHPEAWSDLKSFANPNGKELDTAMADAVRYSRYHVQAVVQRDGVEAIRNGQIQIVGEASEAERALIAAIQMRPDECACFYIFQEKGGIPNLTALEFEFWDVPLNTRFHNPIGDAEGVARIETLTRRKSELHHRASNDIFGARRTFMLYSQVYPPGTPWRPIEGRRSMSSLPFSQGWLEGKY